MELREEHRQIVAGLGSALAFLLVFFGLNLVVWFALGAALVVYVAILLLIRRAPPPSERYLAEGVTEADLDTALAALGEAAGRLARLEGRQPPPDIGLFAKMAETIERIRSHHERDAQDLRHTRRFLRHDLPRLVETSESYVDLSERAVATNGRRLGDLAARIRSYAPALERIEQACLENDFHKLDVETEVLSEQLAHR